MKRLLATATGIGLAAGLAIAAPTDRAADLVARYYAATDETGISANWSDWHSEASHTLTIHWGAGQPDEHITYSVSDWENLPDWREDPAMAEAFSDYAETGRSNPELTINDTRSVTGEIITAITRVDYSWQGYDGQMIQTDRFHILRKMGRPVIRTLTTTLDYR